MEKEERKNELSITFNEWVNYINLRKILLLKQIDRTSILDTSNETTIFNANLKKIFSMEIFDLSRISYLALSFLAIYIDNHLLSILEDDPMQALILNTHSLTKQSLTTQSILEFFINLIVHIEFILNLHFFIIIYIIRQNKSATKEPIQNNNNTSRKPKILFKLEKICNDIETLIKPSTTILLLLKINHKLCNILDMMDNKLMMNEIRFITQAKELNNKLSCLLDGFILTMANNINCQNKQSQTPDTQTIHDNIIDRYELCINYICDLANILYKYFDIGFDTLIKYIIKEYTILETTKNIETSKKSISSLLQNELNILEAKLFEY